MRGRLSTLAFIAYVALDLSNPFVPGAFTFNPDECVEAARSQEGDPVILPAPGDGRAAASPDVAVQVRRTSELMSRPQPHRGWRPRFAGAHAAPPSGSSSAPPSGPDDH